MSFFPTRSEVKRAVADELPEGLSIDVAIQELVDRAYEAGACIGSRKEVEIDLSTERTTWSEYDVILIDPESYDGIVSIRDNEKPRSVKRWKIRDVDSEHQAPGDQAKYVLDHGFHTISSNLRRVYQLPYDLEESDEIVRAMMKIRAPRITADTDEIPVKNVYAAKLGLLAIGYENEADARAPAAWQTFYAEMGLAQKRNDGVKQRHVGYDSGLRRSPTNFA